MRHFSLFFLVSLLIFSCKSRNASDSSVHSSRPDNPRVCNEYDLTDHDTILNKIKNIRTSDLMSLFYCDLPNMGGHVSPEDYLSKMQTRPTEFDWSQYHTTGRVTVNSEFWDVRWGLGLDFQAWYGRITEVTKDFTPFLNKFLEETVQHYAYIKKEFPNPPEGDHLVGWTSTPYSEELYNQNPTTNFIYETRLNDENAKDLPILMMKYREFPWYITLEENNPFRLPANEWGFADYFRFLTDDFIVARGLIGRYFPINNEVPLSTYAGFFNQFWMVKTQKTHTVDLRQSTKFFSALMVKQLWQNAKEGSLNVDDLIGEWSMDLVMNVLTKRDHGKLTITGNKGGTMALRSSNQIEQIANTHDGKGTDIRVANLDPALSLRRVEEGVDVLAGKLCFQINYTKDIESLPSEFHDFIPLKIKTLFLTQFVEGQGPTMFYCNYYLLRKNF